MEGYTQELNHVNTCRVTLAKPKCLSSGSWSVLRWLLGCLVHAPWFSCTQGKPGLPKQTKSCVDFEAHRVCFCFLHELDISGRKRPFFIKEVKSGFFPLNHYVALTFHLNTCEGYMTRTTESFFGLMLKTVIHGIQCKPIYTNYILKVFLIEWFHRENRTSHAVCGRHIKHATLLFLIIQFYST